MDTNAQAGHSLPHNGHLDLSRDIALPDPDLAAALDQQAATSEVLRLIAASPANLTPVFDAVAASVARLTDTPDVVILKVEDGRLRHAASVGSFGQTIGAEIDLPIDRTSVCGVALADRHTVHIEDLAALTDPQMAAAKAIQLRYGQRTMIAAPILDGDVPLGTIAVLRREVRPFSERQIALLQTFADQAVIAIRNANLFRQLQARSADLAREVEAHQRSKAMLQCVLDATDGFAIVGRSAAVARLRQQISLVAQTESTVLVQGETGTGKELVARAIHEQGARRDRPLIRLNCAALPRELVESELFGHEKGSFTGALQQRRGRFELADGGTLLLDEVGEMPLEAQAKLLRVLQEREFERVGGSRVLRADVRVIAVTNRDLTAEIAAGRFRADLFYRLNVFPITVPPLRERLDDVEPLLAHFAAKVARRLGRPLPGIAPVFVQMLRMHDWPGNIRELENLVERALIVSPGGLLDGTGLLPAPAPRAHTGRSSVAHDGDGNLQAVEREHIRRVLDTVAWRVEGDRGAAEQLGLNPSTLRGRMRKLGIRKPA
jgi:transcriptional regulator with GAF, ATPase, and Fis domain